MAWCNFRKVFKNDNNFMTFDIYSSFFLQIILQILRALFGFFPLTDAADCSLREKPSVDCPSLSNQ